MADQQLIDALNDCIDRLAAGESIAECLRRYPQYAAALRPLLEAGKTVERAQVTPYEVAAAQERVRLRVARLAQAPRHQAYTGWLALAASIVLAFAVIFASVRAESSLPGDQLYGLKRFTENVRLGLSAGALEELFDQRRLDEIHQLLSLHRAAQVEFDGEIEQINGTSWAVAGLTLHVDAGTPGSDTAHLGDLVEVQAHTTDQGELVTSLLRILNRAIVPTATPSPTRTPTPTETSTPPSTQTPSVESTPAPTDCMVAPPAGWVRYVVQSGDTVTILAENTGANLDEIVSVNCLPESLMIIVGQPLYLPALPSSSPQPTILPTAGQQSGDQGQIAASPTPHSEDHGGDDHGGQSGSSSGDSGSGGSGDSGGGHSGPG